MESLDLSLLFVLYRFSICRYRLRDRTEMPGRGEVELIIMLASKSS